MDPPHLFLRFMVVVAGLLSADAAFAARAHFLGPHPVSTADGGGMCLIEVPHSHSYEPEHTDVLYVKDHDDWVFVGDPTAYEEAGPRHAYYGHHPLTWVQGGEHYCWISGPHHHWYAPGAAVGFANEGGFFWFTAARPAWYRARLGEHAAVDAYYVGLPIVRLSVDVVPPFGFFGFYLRGPWVYEQVGWYDHDHRDKHGPPPWAPAWGRRRHDDDRRGRGHGHSVGSPAFFPGGQGGRGHGGHEGNRGGKGKQGKQGKHGQGRGR